MPNVPNIRHILGTKSSSAQLTPKSSFREGSSFLFSVFSRWGKGLNEKNGQKVAKIYDFLVFHLIPPPPPPHLL